MASRMEYDMPNNDMNELAGLEVGQNFLNNMDAQNIEPEEQPHMMHPDDDAYNPQMFARNSLQMMEDDA